MNAITLIPAGAVSEDFKRMRARPVSRKSPPIGLMTRQATLSLAAFRAFDNRSAALEFLNNPAAQLSGRPIDIAGASDAGLQTTLALLPQGPPPLI